MRFSCMPFLFLFAFLLGGMPALAAKGCPTTALLESTNGKYYVIVFGAPAPTQSGFDIVFYSQSATYALTTPLLDVGKKSPVPNAPFRSAPVLVRNPAADPFLGAAVQPTQIREGGRCPAESIVVPSVESLTAPDRHVDPRTAALEDQAASETGGAATALVPAPTPSTVPLACTQPFKDADAGAVSVPEFPAAARQAGASGTTLVRVDLDPAGNVTDATILESAGNADLDAAALAAARKTTYKPAIFACQAQKSAHVMRFDFTK